VLYKARSLCRSLGLAHLVINGVVTVQWCRCNLQGRPIYAKARLRYRFPTGPAKCNVPSVATFFVFDFAADGSVVKWWIANFLSRVAATRSLDVANLPGPRKVLSSSQGPGARYQAASQPRGEEMRGDLATIRADSKDGVGIPYLSHGSVKQTELCNGRAT